MMKCLRLIAAWIGGIIVAAVLFVVATAACWVLAAIYTALAGSYSVPADVGWNNLILLIFVWPIIGIGSLVGGLFAGNFLNNKMRPHTDQKGPAA